jgi:hypothetical protein
MITRRTFVVATGAATVSAAAVPAPALSLPAQPLRAARTVRRLRVEPDPFGHPVAVAVSDASPVPRPLIRPAVLDRAFGADTAERLAQPDHWAMIDAGWFSGADLYLPEHPDPAWFDWHAIHKPTSEAFDLLFEVFADRLPGRFGGTIPEFGMAFGEHPATPRVARVLLLDPERLPALAAEIAARSDRVVLDLEIRAPDPHS